MTNGNKGKQPPELRRLTEIEGEIEELVREILKIEILAESNVAPNWAWATFNAVNNAADHLLSVAKASSLGAFVEAREANRDDPGMRVPEAAKYLALSETEVRRIAKETPKALGRRDYGNGTLVLSEKAVMAFGRRRRWPSSK